MLTGPQNMPVFGDNQLTPEEKRDIIAYIQTPARTTRTRAAGASAGSARSPRAWRSSWSAWWRWCSRRCGLRGSHDRRAPARRARRRRPSRFDVDDPQLTRFDLVREGARRDGVEIVHYEPQFPVPGTKAEKRVERTIALLFLLTGAARARVRGRLHLVAVGVRARAHVERSYYTPLLGLTLGARAVRHRLRRSSSGPRSCCPRRSRSRTGTTAPSDRDEQQAHRRDASLNMVDETGHQAPAAAQGGDRCCRPGAGSAWSRPRR